VHASAAGVCGSISDIPILLDSLNLQNSPAAAVPVVNVSYFLVDRNR
jgi:hypothetical protein